MSFSPDGSTLASTSEDGIVRLWNVVSHREKGVLRGHIEVATAVSFSPDGSILASGSGDGAILLWDLSPYVTADIPVPTLMATVPLASRTFYSLQHSSD